VIEHTPKLTPGEAAEKLFITIETNIYTAKSRRKKKQVNLMINHTYFSGKEAVHSERSLGESGVS